MSKLRTNQIEPVKRGIQFFNSVSPKPSLIVAPTAFGKSWVIAHICTGISGKTIVLQPSIELLDQNYEKLVALGATASIFSASKGVKEYGDITYATIGSIKNLGKEFKARGYINLIIDEAHMYPREFDSMLGGFLADSGITKVLGLTATPFKLQVNSYNRESYSILSMLTSKSKKGSFFKDIIHVTQIQDIINDGFWSKLEYEVYDFDTGELEYNTIKSDYTYKSVSNAYISQDITGKIIDRVEGLDRKSILVFVPTIQHAIDLAGELPDAAALHSNLSPKERSRIVQEFKSQQLRIMVNVSIASIGLDVPMTDCIISGRSTASLAWFYQALGRGTRIHPSKKDCLVIDFAGNTQKFGKLENLYYKREGIWRLYGEGGKRLSGVPIDQITSNYRTIKY